MLKLLLLNGPPRSGKDTIANYIEEKYEKVEHVKLATPLKMETLKRYLKKETFTSEEYHTYCETLKDVPLEVFGGLTPRKAIIKTDKKLIRERGEGYLVKALFDLMEKAPGKLYVCSDGGKPDELETLKNRTPEGSRVLLARVYRQGTSFRGDSRGYHEPFSIENSVTHYQTIINEGLDGLSEHVKMEIQSSLFNFFNIFYKKKEVA